MSDFLAAKFQRLAVVAIKIVGVNAHLLQNGPQVYVVNASGDDGEGIEAAFHV